MKLKEILEEGPVRKLRNATLAAKYYVDSAELEVHNALRLLEGYLNDPKSNPQAVEEVVTHLRDAKKQLRGLKNFFKNREL